MTSVPELVLATLIAEKAQNLPDFQIITFVNIADNGDYAEETRTYRELHRNGQALVRGFRTLGVAHHDNIALMMNNHPEFVESMVATTTSGATFVPIDPRTMGVKLSYMLDFTDCKGVVCADYCVEAILAVAQDCPSLKWLIVVPTGKTLPDLPSAGLTVRNYRELLSEPGEDIPVVEQSLDEPMLMMFTSGTTGNPKAVIHSHRKYMALATSFRRVGLTQNDKLYTGLSLTHINAQNTLRNSLALGVPAVLSRRFTKSRLWDICRRYHCTIFNLLGGMIPEVYAAPEQPDDADNPVRLIFTSGMPATIWKDFERRFGVKLSEGYGSTEGGGMSNPPGTGPVGSIGKPSGDWDAAILDENGQPLGAHEEGEICFRRKDGAPVVVDYYKNSEASGDKVRGGWLHMGDLGHQDENGWFYFHHRVGGGVRRNGDFVNTALVESVLTRSPLVVDVFVYGFTTDKNVAGEKMLVAAIVPAEPATFAAAELLAFCRMQLEKNDVPDYFQVLTEIPKTISEKPIEKACIDLLQQSGMLGAPRTTGN